MRCSCIDNSLIELYNRTSLSLEELTLDCKFTVICKSLHVCRHLIEIHIQAYTKHTLLRLNLLK